MRGRRQGGYVHTAVLSNLIIKGEGKRKVEIKRQLRERLRWGRVTIPGIWEHSFIWLYLSLFISFSWSYWFDR